MLTLTLLASLLATQPAVGAEHKVAYVDMAQALNEVNDGKSAKAKLKKEFEARQKQLDAEQTRLKKKKEDIHHINLADIKEHIENKRCCSCPKHHLIKITTIRRPKINQ